jgi:hypothetical protein
MVTPAWHYFIWQRRAEVTIEILGATLEEAFLKKGNFFI